MQQRRRAGGAHDGLGLPYRDSVPFAATESLRSGNRTNLVRVVSKGNGQTVRTFHRAAQTSCR